LWLLELMSLLIKWLNLSGLIVFRFWLLLGNIFGFWWIFGRKMRFLDVLLRVKVQAMRITNPLLLAWKLLWSFILTIKIVFQTRRRKSSADAILFQYWWPWMRNRLIAILLWWSLILYKIHMMTIIDLLAVFLWWSLKFISIAIAVLLK